MKAQRSVRLVLGVGTVWSLMFGGCVPMGTNGGGGNANERPVPDDGGSPATRCVTGTANGAATVSYADDLLPLLEMSGCMTSGCHGGTFVSSRFDLSTYEGIFGPGDGAEVLMTCNVIPGDPDGSYLLEKLTQDNPRFGDRMPLFQTPLSADQIELIRTWIAEGAQNN